MVGDEFGGEPDLVVLAVPVVPLRRVLLDVGAAAAGPHHLPEVVVECGLGVLPGFFVHASGPHQVRVFREVAGLEGFGWDTVVAPGDDGERRGCLPLPAVPFHEPLADDELPSEAVRRDPAVPTDRLFEGRLEPLPSHAVGERLDLAGEGGCALADVVGAGEEDRERAGIVVPAGQFRCEEAAYLARQPVVPQDAGDGGAVGHVLPEGSQSSVSRSCLAHTDLAAAERAPGQADSWGVEVMGPPNRRFGDAVPRTPGLAESGQSRHPRRL